MTSGLDKLEEEIMAEMWNAYIKAVIDHALNPRNIRSIADADGFGRVTGP
jgi:nitrogen fixation NifU-like protein